MNRTATRWTGGRFAGVGILILGIALALAPEAFRMGSQIRLRRVWRRRVLWRQVRGRRKPQLGRW